MYESEKVKVKPLIRIRLLATLWTAAYQAPPPMGFSRQEYWSGVPLPSLASSQPNDKSSILIVGRTVQVLFSLKQKPSSGHFLVKLIILVMVGFNSVNPGSLSLPLVPGVVCTSSIAALGGGLWAVHLPCLPLHTGDRRGLWPAVTRSSLAVPLDQDHEEEFVSPLGLFAHVSSLSLS